MRTPSIERRVADDAARRRGLFAASCAGIFVFGSVLALLGTLFGLPEMRARLGLDLMRQGDLLSLQFFGILLSTLVTGPLVDRFGKRVVLAVSPLLVAAALVGFAVARGFEMAALAAFTLGVGGGGLNTATNVLVSDLFEDDRAARLNLLGVAFGIGALFIPLTAASLSTWLTIPRLLGIAAALAAAWGVAFGAQTFPPPKEADSVSFAQLAKVTRYPAILLFAAMLFFQSGNEASIGGWTSTYVEQRGWHPRTATWVLAGFWAALLAGRLISSRLVGAFEKSRIILASAIGAAVGCLVLLLAGSLATLTLGVIVMGLSLSSVYPTALAMVGDRYQRFTGTVFGLMFSSGLLGGMAMPWAIGQLAASLDVQSAMWLPLIGALMVAALISIIASRGG